jgi:hypothetical protein
MTCGAHMSACRREGEDTVSGRGVAGSWARSGRGLEWFPGSSFIVFLFFLFFFSDFLISFIGFAKMLQIKSNLFQRFAISLQGFNSI